MKSKSTIKKVCYLAMLNLMLSSKVDAEYIENKNNLNIEIIGNPKYADALVENMNNFSPSLANYMNSMGLKIYLLDNDAEREFTNIYGYDPGEIRGFTAYGESGYEPSIYVECGDSSNYYYEYNDSANGLSLEEFCYKLSKNTMLHELGHCMDLYYLSQTEEFTNIFYEEAENFTNTTSYNVDNFKIHTNISTPGEYFAQAFAGYMNYKDEMELYCPKTCEYFNSLMRNIEREYKEKTLTLN